MKFNNTCKDQVYNYKITKKTIINQYNKQKQYK